MSSQGQKSQVFTAGQLIIDRKLPRTPEEYAEEIRKTHAAVSTQGQESPLAMAGPSIIGGKLPRTPEEYAEGIRKTHAAVSTQGQELQLVMAGPSKIGRKLPRTPEEYAKLVMKTKNTNGDRKPIARNSNKGPAHRKKTGIKSSGDHTNRTQSGVNEYGEGVLGYVVQPAITQDYVKRQGILSIGSPNASRATKSDNMTRGYEKLNPETMESLQGFGKTGDARDHVNMKDMLPSEFAHIGCRGIRFQELNDAGDSKDHVTEKDIPPMDLSLNACGISPDNKNCGYKKPNPETMESFQDSGNADDSKDHIIENDTPQIDFIPNVCHGISPDNTNWGYEKLNPETMESFEELGNAGDSKDQINEKDILPTDFSLTACRGITPDNRNCGYEKLNPETMESFQELDNAGNSKDHVIEKDIPPTDFSLNVCRGISPDNKKCGYEKLNPETMESIQE